MAVALRPGDFRCGADAPDGSAWEIDGTVYATNPSHGLTEADWAMVRLWQFSRGSGVGSGMLPDGDGPLHEAVLNLDAFDVMTAAEQEYRREWGRDA